MATWEFDFEVNKTFLESPHRITIPRGEVRYRVVLEVPEAIIKYPRGETLYGRIYLGKAGYGEYYQISHEPGSRIPEYLKMEDMLRVRGIQEKGKTTITLSKHG